VSHLTDLYDAEIARGLDEERALEVARDQLGDPAQLLRAVQQYKEIVMASFRRYILVPGLFATALTTLAGSILDEYRLDHLFGAGNFLSGGRHVWFFGPLTPWGNAGFVSIDLPLLFANLFAGSVAAYLCMRLGGERRQRLWACLVPAVAPILVILANLAELALVRARVQAPMPIGHLLWTVSGYLISWTILPATALLIGAAPFLTRRTEHSHSLSTS
jgi:hypothetical protein